jgi:5-enolpyruvylshikimate-3-phosphate synthase
VTAKWGFGSVPADLSFAATVMVAGIINNQNSQDTDNKEVQSETIGRYSVTYKSGSTQATDYVNAMNILKSYKRYA